MYNSQVIIDGLQFGNDIFYSYSHIQTLYAVYSYCKPNSSSEMGTNHTVSVLKHVKRLINNLKIVRYSFASVLTSDKRDRFRVFCLR